MGEKEKVQWCIRKLEPRWEWGVPILEWPEKSWDATNDIFAYWTNEDEPKQYLQQQRRMNG